MRWHRLSILMERIAEEITNFGYFKVDNQGEMVQAQLGVFRTNCIDCLDRTNVVQSMIARRVLERQLKDSKVLEAGELPGSDSLFEFIFKNMWADNADACSTQYSGTGALKTDFTRLMLCILTNLLVYAVRNIVYISIVNKTGDGHVISSHAYIELWKFFLYSNKKLQYMLQATLHYLQK